MHNKKIKREDIAIALVYWKENPATTREQLGKRLEDEGLAVNHHTFSGCRDKFEYINLILDQVFIDDLVFIE